MCSIKFPAILLIAALSIGTVYAAVIDKIQADGKDAERLTSPPQIADSDGEKVFKSSPGTYRRYELKKRIKVDPAKKYKVSVKIKQDGENPALVYIGFVPYTADGKTIGTHNGYYNTPNSITTLAVPAEKGSKTLTVKDASKWLKGKYYAVAFNVKENMSDIPNFEVSKPITKIEKTGDVYTITLEAPLSKSYPAGTKVRQHRYGNTYVYTKYGKVPKEWTVWEGKPAQGKIFRKAVFISPMIMINAKAKGSGTVFTDFVVEEISAK